MSRTPLRSLVCIAPRLRALLTGLAIVVSILGGASAIVAAQPPATTAAQDGFLPVDESKVQEHLPAALRAIIGPARTGRIGDGKILVLPCLGDYLSW